VFRVSQLSCILRLFCTLDKDKSIFFFNHCSVLQIAGSGNGSERRVDHLKQLTVLTCFICVSVYLPSRQAEGPVD